MSSMVDRFWAKVDTSGDCWEWTGSKHGQGYGLIISPSRRVIRAHRFSAMLHFGMFDRRVWVMHTCDNPSCVRPEHLRLGDAKQNAQDMTAKGRHRTASITHCPHGHEYTKANTRMSKGRRHCRVCDKARFATREEAS